MQLEEDDQYKSIKFGHHLYFLMQQKKSGVQGATEMTSAEIDQ